MLCTKGKDCTGCGVCSKVCPQKCIQMSYNKEHFIEPIVDGKKCINCGLCNKVCPVQNKKVINDKQNYYIAQLKDKEALNKCASGGAFYGIAKEILLEKGIVYGVGVNRNKSLTYERITSIKELDKILGSKYYQCEIKNNIYEKIIEDSKNNIVLVSGTPCQMSAIKNMPGITQKNLYTLEIICQGVPNEYVIKKYYDEMEKRNRKKIVNHYFRSKDKYIGKNYLNKYIYDDNTIEYFIGENDPLSLSFQRNVFLRNSCYSCHYASEKRVSDFVVGDYWEKVNEHNSIDYKKGISSILCNTNKANELFINSNNFNYMKKDEFIFENNIPFHKSVKKPFSRYYSYKLLNRNFNPYELLKICCFKYYIKKSLMNFKKNKL